MQSQKNHSSPFTTPQKLEFEAVDLDPKIENIDIDDLQLAVQDAPRAGLPPNSPHPILINPTGGEFRQPDSHGEGHFGASRNSGTASHEGQDIVGQIGQDVRAPFSGTVAKIGYAYADDLSFRYIQVDGADDISARVFYVDPAAEIGVGSKVEAGDVLGTLQSLRDRYPDITDHTHLELRVGNQLVDPAPYVVNSANAELLVEATSEANSILPKP